MEIIEKVITYRNFSEQDLKEIHKNANSVDKDGFVIHEVQTYIDHGSDRLLKVVYRKEYVNRLFYPVCNMMRA